MKENLIKEKTYNFSIRIINLSKYLRKEKHEFQLSKQVLRSGTSIGANTEEAVGAQSRKDFVYKISMPYKEARETDYWLRLLKDTSYITHVESDSLRKDCMEILRILGKIQITMKNKHNGNL